MMRLECLANTAPLNNAVAITSPWTISVLPVPGGPARSQRSSPVPNSMNGSVTVSLNYGWFSSGHLLDSDALIIHQQPAAFR